MVPSPPRSADNHDYNHSPVKSSLLFENESTDLQHDRFTLPPRQTGAMSAGTGVEVSTTQRMISATWGSLLTSLLVTPLDVVRVRLQSQPSPNIAPLNLSRFPAYATNFQKLPADLGVKACCREVFFVGNNGQFCLVDHGHAANAAAADCAVEETQKRTFNSTLDGIRKIARNEGLSTLWRGLSPTLVMAIPANVIYFTGYDWLRYNKASPIRNHMGEAYTPLVAGSVARVAAAIAVSPIEMFRTRMQAASGETTGLFRETLVGLHKMTQTQGYTSLWRGLTLTMWRDVPFSGIYWWGYEAIRNSLADARDTAGGKVLDSSRTMTGPRDSKAEASHTTTFVDSFTAGALSGGFAAFVTTPFDVGKTRRQVYMHAGEDRVGAAVAARAAVQTAGTKLPEELPMVRFLYHILKEEGASGLFKGWAARCLKVAPACAIMISSYEMGKRWAKAANTKKEEQIE